ncbi:MAG: tRNA (N(6)-L-threonylcarbamoyladenosine(37)-C(2))-methylthiotransferase MtaB [Firmicutes bacterium]|nr:tRNA (N(6)-L-threonylcarbamoyladenosine(37)-C(2))-methylthiotransferase MtaB [Bacillota bacterium]
MKKAASYALGCKVNQVESEAIAEAFAERGYEIVDINDKADVYVINTCSVTNLGDKKSRQLIRKVKRVNPEAVVVAVGCYAQTAPDDIKTIEGVNIILGTKGRNEIVDYVENYTEEKGVQCLVGEIMHERDFEPISVHKLAGRTRAYLKIQDGCSQFCSYCIIPYARGPIRSRDEEEVLSEVRTLAENGFKEVVLTGIHVASYGKDLKTTNLLQVIKKVHEIDGIERIRLSSIEPNIVTEEFAAEMAALPKACHHFHLSLQSGCNKTLKEMNRKYTAEKYTEAVEILRKHMPDVAVTTDIIVGFPGETDEDFEECYAFAEKIGFAKIHVFPYSPKRGTPAAARKDQVSPQKKDERSEKLMALSDKMAEDFINGYVGKPMPVLFEQCHENGTYEGHTSNYINVTVKSDMPLKNVIKDVIIECCEKEKAFGRV